jgi:hypothetical protein
VSNEVRGNSIHSNTLLGVDLVPTGQSCGDGTVTPNDAGDGDTGPNNLMNFPVITSASYDAVNTTISGTLDTLDPANATVDVYASGYGEGRVHLGSTTAPGGSWTLVLSGASPYIYLSATATRTESTSEFSLVPETDNDSDGLADLYETNAGIYVSPTTTTRSATGAARAAAPARRAPTTVPSSPTPARRTATVSRPATTASAAT